MTFKTEDRWGQSPLFPQPQSIRCSPQDLVGSLAGRCGTPSCERTGAAADIVLPVAALGAGYLGGTRLGSLAAAGLMTERREGAVARLSAAMYSDPAPWCRPRCLPHSCHTCRAHRRCCRPGG